MIDVREMIGLHGADVVRISAVPCFVDWYEMNVRLGQHTQYRLYIKGLEPMWKTEEELSAMGLGR